LSWLKLLINR